MTESLINRAQQLADTLCELDDVLSDLNAIDDGEWCERTGGVLLSEDQAAAIFEGRDTLRRLLGYDEEPPCSCANDQSRYPHCDCSHCKSGGGGTGPC